MQSAPTLDQLSEQESLVLDALIKGLCVTDRVKAPNLGRVIDAGPSRVREVVADMRLKGVLIASDNKGFYLARTPEEAEATSRHLWSRIRAIAKVARAFDRARGGQFDETFSKYQQVRMVFGEEVA